MSRTEIPGYSRTFHRAAVSFHDKVLNLELPDLDGDPRAHGNELRRVGEHHPVDATFDWKVGIAEGPHLAGRGHDENRSGGLKDEPRLRLPDEKGRGSFRVEHPVAELQHVTGRRSPDAEYLDAPIAHHQAARLHLGPNGVVP